MLRRLGALLGLTLVFVTGPATRADEANRECDNDQDVTMVVDFQALGGGVNVRCAPQPIETGFDVFRRANVSYDQYQGFVCRIAGRPDDEPCNRYPPSNYYWVYWTAQRGGEWKYSNYGAGARKPPPGSVDGWSFFARQGEDDKPEPPRYPVPAPIVHATTTTSTSASAGAPPPPAPTSTQLVLNPPGKRANPEPVRDGAATTTTQAPAPDVFAVPTEATTTTIKLGHVDLSVDHGDGGSSAGFVASAVAVAGLAAVGYAFVRLRGR